VNVLPTVQRRRARLPLANPYDLKNSSNSPLLVGKVTYINLRRMSRKHSLVGHIEENIAALIYYLRNRIGSSRSSRHFLNSDEEIW
jgi:hypothetical protein